MKNLAFVCAAAVAVSVSPASGAEAAVPGVPSSITAVAVYLDRAVVTRTAGLDLDIGTREVAIERLPANLLDQSLQVSGRGTADATILDVTARQVFVEETPNERVKALEDEILSVQKQTRSLNDRAATLNEQREFVRRILASAATPQPVPAGTAATGRTPLDELRGIYGYSDEAFGKIATELQSLDAQKTALSAKTNALQAQLAQLRDSRGRSYKTVVVRVATAKAGNLQLNVAYTVPNASWTPAYDARLRSAERAVELSYYGVVRQSTGEDWVDVALSLSTARPSLGGGAPELPGWVLDRARPIDKEMIVALGVTSLNEAASLSPFEAGRGQGEIETRGSSVGSGGRLQLNTAAFADASVDAGAISATFKIAAPASLSSNDTAQKVAITIVRFPSNLRYESTPKMREAAYLSATTTNSTDYPFLAGAMNTFLDDAFVATSAMRTVMAGEKFDLALGADEGMAIKRKLVNRFNEDTGLTGKGRRVTYEFLITATNHKKTPEQILFREAVPVSRDEKIVVKLIAPLEKDIGTPEKLKEVTREADGKLAWRLNLKPGEKREVTLKFSLDFPADLSVSGLE